MLLNIFHHWVFWIILGVSTAWIAWVFSELRHAAPDPRDKEPDVTLPPEPSCEEGIMRDIDDYETLFTWKQRTSETRQ